MNICVFGASSASIERSYIDRAESLGKMLAERGHTLIFGAGADGMMGGAARGAASVGGRIVGVVPGFFNVDGILFDNCSELIRTETMRERKQIMEDRSDAFIVTAGGIGTFEEFFEILTLKQLGRHQKPIVVLNTGSYYDSMLAMLENSVSEHFMTRACTELFYTTPDETDALDYIESYRAQSYNILELKNIRE